MIRAAKKKCRQIIIIQNQLYTNWERDTNENIAFRLNKIAAAVLELCCHSLLSHFFYYSGPARDNFEEGFSQTKVKKLEQFFSCPLILKIKKE